MTDPEQISDSTRRAATVMVVLNSISTAMMLTGVNVALPEIARALEIDAVGISWIPMAYLMASAACVLGFGRLADMYGRKRIYLLGSLGIVLTSVFTACAGTETQLLFGRFLQGVFAAMVFATNVAIVSSVYPPAKRGTAIGYAVSAIY
ncbi:MAG: MFS transporter, partial [Gammaproteobacteria bacterium]